MTALSQVRILLSLAGLIQIYDETKFKMLQVFANETVYENERGYFGFYPAEAEN